MLVNQIQCLQCGAPLDVLPDSIVVVCDYCGSILGPNTARLFTADAYLRAYREGVRSFLAPTRMEARRTQLLAAMEQAKAQGDRRAFAASAKEYATIDAAIHPEFYDAPPAELSLKIRQSAKLMELLAFEPELKALQAEVAQATSDLLRAQDPVAQTRRLVDLQIRFYDRLLAHPDYPADSSANPRVMGRQAARANVEAVAAMLGPGVADRIFQEVFGDEQAGPQAPRCRNCGAELPIGGGPRLNQCPYCGSVVEVTTEDRWLLQLKALWPTVRASHPEEFLAQGAIQLCLQSYHTTGSLPEAAQAFEFLEWAVPHLSKAALLQAAQSLAAWGDPRLADFSRELRRLLEGWQPRASREEAPRPVAPLDVPTHRGEVAEDPWVLQAVAQWSMGRHATDEQDIEASLLGQALTPFYLGGSITPAQAMEFFRQAEPGYSKSRMRTQAKLMARGLADSHPQISRFLEALGAALG